MTAMEPTHFVIDVNFEKISILTLVGRETLSVVNWKL